MIESPARRVRRGFGRIAVLLAIFAGLAAFAFGSTIVHGDFSSTKQRYEAKICMKDKQKAGQLFLRYQDGKFLGYQPSGCPYPSDYIYEAELNKFDPSAERPNYVFEYTRILGVGLAFSAFVFGSVFFVVYGIGWAISGFFAEITAGER